MFACLRKPRSRTITVLRWTIAYRWPTAFKCRQFPFASAWRSSHRKYAAFTHVNRVVRARRDGQGSDAARLSTRRCGIADDLRRRCVDVAVRHCSSAPVSQRKWGHGVKSTPAYREDPRRAWWSRAAGRNGVAGCHTPPVLSAGKFGARAHARCWRRLGADVPRAGQRRSRAGARFTNGTRRARRAPGAPRRRCSDCISRTLHADQGCRQLPTATGGDGASAVRRGFTSLWLAVPFQPVSTWRMAAVKLERSSATSAPFTSKITSSTPTLP